MAFQKIYLLNYFTYFDKANCINDLDKILAKNPIDTRKDINLICHNNTLFHYLNVFLLK